MPLSRGSSKVTPGNSSTVDDIPVKSLEQIRWEKAARMTHAESEGTSPQPDSTQSGRAQNRLALKRTIRQERKIYIPPGAQKPGKLKSLVHETFLLRFTMYTCMCNVSCWYTALSAVIFKSWCWIKRKKVGVQWTWESAVKQHHNN